MPRKRRVQHLFELEAQASGSENDENDGDLGDADDDDNDFLDNEPVEESQPFALLFQQQQQAVNQNSHTLSSSHLSLCADSMFHPFSSIPPFCLFVVR